MTTWCVVEHYVTPGETPSTVVDQYFPNKEEAALYAKMRNKEVSEDPLVEGELHYWVEQAREI